MDRIALGKKLFTQSYITGEFKLRSGTTSGEYFDKYRFESQPDLLKAIAIHLKPLIPPDTEAFAALEMGGIPIATALSLETGIPCAFVRKEAKAYGTCNIAEGIDISGKKLCIIEDIITTGGQVIESTKELRSAEAIISTVLCVVYRGASSDGQEPRLSQIDLVQKSLFTLEELKSL